jgi:prevent-host-death family protein
MTITKLTSREFNQDASGAKNAARTGPVIITDRGRPAHVLMTFADYRKLTAQHTSIADLLAMQGIEDVALPIPPMKDLARPADLS